MADIGASNWTEADASNTTAAPDGAPEGMAPSGVNDTMRAMMGATKRFYDWQSQKTTGGTSTAYTLSYTVAPGALVDGMVHVVVFNATNGAAATLNVNALGAKPLYLNMGGTWQAAPAGSIPANFVTTVLYDSSSGAYRVVIPPGAPMVWVASPSGVSTVDVIAGSGIPTTINHMFCEWELLNGTNAQNIFIQFYDSAGSLDTGGTSYGSSLFAWSATTTTSVTVSTGTAINLTGTNVYNAGSPTYGASGDFSIAGVQSANRTWVNLRSSYVENTGVSVIGVTGVGLRNAAGRISGLRFGVGSGTFTGKITVTGYI